MNFKILTPAAVLATLALTVTPAFAQHSGGGHSRSSGGSHAAARSAGPARSGAPAARSAAPSRGVYAAQSRGGAVVRGGAVPRGFANRGFVGRGFASRGVVVAPFRFFSPFYTFRPRFSLGFGLWVGYPVAYSYPFYYGYPYPYYAPPYDPYYPPPSYGYPNQSSAYPPANDPQSNGSGQSGYYEPDPGTSAGSSVMAQPGTASGGVSFEITPSTAEVFVDGTLVGRVSDLGPTTQPLALTPGRHHLEIRAPGYQTLSVDTDIVAGQIIPYQGQMQPAR